MSKPAGTTSIAVGSARLYRSGLLVHLTLLLLSNKPAASQAPVDIYRFILGIDVPEPTALVALGSAPLHVLRGSAPKPLSATIVASPLPASGRSVSAGLDFSPYFMAGGGKRPLASYRSNTFAGRLLRVLTKTMVSIGMARQTTPRRWSRSGSAAPFTILTIRC